MTGYYTPLTICTAMQSKITAIQTPREHIRILTLEKPDGFDYQAGQYVMLGFSDLPLRPYSIACAPDNEALEIHIKDNHGQVTPYVMNSAHNGEEVILKGPFGNMIYTADHENNDQDAPLVLIAGGLGITPMKSIIEAAISDNHTGEIILFWGTAVQDDFYLDGYLEDLIATHSSFKCIKVCSDPVGSYAATFLEKQAAENSTDLTRHKIYIAGSPAMIESTTSEFVDIGAKKSNIYYDTFVLPTM